MVFFQSVRDFAEILVAPFQQLFEWFPDLKFALEGILFLSLSYFGWRAIK